ncbi:sensor domain-containing diguanylate cyclase [Leptospira interrogans]|uniref:diguanylate cyclase n=2 Tax=Leptospira interrogans TaxID=173 RepID=M3HC53_LEPIR|nr:sensor domain-containing diguanylate cyclase [Leptospira interrogans]EMG10265.1 diguanylate cyclase (GGDEF) domain protein [Leptospira interrogans serovar Grippotyphosa str. LT2186]EMN73029.1 diguanylate cyclase (GGDEF) domain protein [Leptospira interrogans serovar Bataviae str. UI 08561]AKP25442.1 diguanylate cyclase [Leptospira interrogans serovar Manilae]AKP29225.1 diguanylate cyclase [Leptospira interrogans serovar Manilae]EKR45753.1 diguanylate cyclase (GGDEF) domain protein [Leptospi
MEYKNEYNLEKFYNYSLDLFSIQRMDGTVISVNPSFERILGWKEEELLGKNPFHLLHPEDQETIVQEFQKLDGGIPRYSIKNRCRCADGTYKHFAWTGFPDIESGLVYITGRDITETIESNRKISQLATELKEANDKLFEQASTDSLTKLKNRRAFNEALNHLVHFSQKQKSPLSLLMIDADHFKDYNDTFGHLEGDKILIILADLLTKALRKGDVLARYGGEEFIVALPLTSEDETIDISERLLQTVREFNWEKRIITVSVGAATYDFNSNSKNINLEYSINLIEQADKALYCSKVNGRNRITHFSKKYSLQQN